MYFNPLLLPLLLIGMCTTRNRVAARTEDRKPLYLLTMVPFPDPKKGTGWDEGLTAFAGARVAQNEVNNHTDLLPGYRIELIVDTIEACSIKDASNGLITFLRHTINTQRPIAAVTGLLCSSHTEVVSPIAGHDGFDLIQLSAASSSIFKTQNSNYPHLWRFLGSSTGYTDTILALMENFDWTRIGIVYDSGSRFFTEIATYLERQIRSTDNESEVVFSTGVEGEKYQQLLYVVQDIRSQLVTVLIVLLNELQTVNLLELTSEAGLVYPQYIWISVETTLGALKTKAVRITDESFFKAINGHIHLHTLTELQNKSTILVSGETFQTFKEKFNQQFEIIEAEYSLPEHHHPNVTYATYLYDQVWAFAMAVNQSLFELEKRNLSIDSYTIGQNQITTIIEDRLAGLSFQGAGGHVQFNEHRGVSTPVEVNWIINQNEINIGKYDPLNPTMFNVSIMKDDVPKDTLPAVLFAIPLPGTVFLYTMVIAVVGLITGQLVLLIRCRNHKAVKATDPYLSLLMFTGCYLLCYSSATAITIGSFDIQPIVYTVVLNSCIIFAVNGLCLILVTLFIKLLRIYRIFVLQDRFKLGKYWRNGFLILIVLTLSAIPNILVALSIGFETTKYRSTIVIVTRGSVTRAEKWINPNLNAGNLFFFVFIAIYFILFQLMIVFIAIRTRKIKYKNFKDTKKVNIYVTILSFTFALGVPIIAILSIQRNEPAVSAVIAAIMLIVTAGSQLILFLPKLWPIFLDKCSKRVTLKKRFTCIIPLSVAFR